MPSEDTAAPLTPIVATGVFTTIESMPVFDTAPETNVNAPCTIENTALPSLVSGCHTISSMVRRPSEPRANEVSSTNTMPTAPPVPVSTRSPWKIGSPVSRLTRLPSVRVAKTSPSSVSTRPMASWAPGTWAWATWLGEAEPARRTARSPAMRAPLSETRSGGVSPAK